MIKRRSFLGSLLAIPFLRPFSGWCAESWECAEPWESEFTVKFMSLDRVWVIRTTHDGGLHSVTFNGVPYADLSAPMTSRPICNQCRGKRYIDWLIEKELKREDRDHKRPATSEGRRRRRASSTDSSLVC